MIRLRNPRFGPAFDVRDHTVAHIAQIRGALRHDAALAFEQGDELFGCFRCGLNRWDTAGNAFLDAFAPGRVTGHGRTYLKQSAGVAGSFRGARAKVSNYGVCGFLKLRHRRWTFVLGQVRCAEGRNAGPARPHHGGVRDAVYNGRSINN